MKTYSHEELAEIMRLHALYLEGDLDGKRADLSYSDLSDSNLSYSDLSDSNLSDSNLSDSDLSGSSLRGVIGFVYVGQRSDGYQFHAVFTENRWRIQAGCKNKTIEEYREHTAGYACAIKRQETLDLLDFAEKRIQLLGKTE